MKNKDLKLIQLKLEKSITPKTKWIILNSPSNPTGACYTEEDVREIAKILENMHLFIF